MYRGHKRRTAVIDAWAESLHIKYREEFKAKEGRYPDEVTQEQLSMINRTAGYRLWLKKTDRKEWDKHRWPTEEQLAEYEKQLDKPGCRM